MTASTDIVVRRCSVRVVRHGGWSWGPQPQQLIEQVIAALPSLIADHLGELPGNGMPDVEITEPVQIAVSLQLTDLLADRFDPIQQLVITGNAESAPSPKSAPEPSPDSRSRSAIGSLAGSSRDTQLEAATAAEGLREAPSLDYASSSASAFFQPTTLVEFLTWLFDRNELDDFLVLLPVGTLETWYQALSALQVGAPAGQSGPMDSPSTAPDRALPSEGDADAAMPSRQERSIAAAATDRIQQVFDLITATAPGDLPRRDSHLFTDVPDLLAAAAASAAATPEEQLRNAIVTVAAWAGRIGAAELPPADDPATELSHRPRQGPSTGARHVGGARLPSPDDPAAELSHRPGQAPSTGARHVGPARLPSPDDPTADVPERPEGIHTTLVPRIGGTELHDPRHPVAELPSRPGQTAADPAGPQPTNPGSAAWAASDVDVASALPFLLLGPLAQAGYLSALVPALQAIGLERDAPTFATALAYTVLGPLERGWRRQPKDLATAAAFAGLTAPVPGQAPTELAQAASLALPALDALITRALAEGHTVGKPLLLVGAEEQAGGGLLLLDLEGLFPVAWTDAVAGLLPAWRMCGSPPVLVAPTALAALRGLAAAGATFLVASPPGRGERWRRLSPHRLWTNGDDRALVQHAVGYREATDLAAGLIQALAADRAPAPLAVSPALTRSLLLAAGLGLGALAWTLWREREPTDPLLALERFSDLSARVNFEPHRVRVRLPLGPRHADLSAHGLLADVHGVPWLGGRVVEFSGG
jgi:hypothetical protein